MRRRSSTLHWRKSLAAIPDGAGKVDGIAVGIGAADAILALRADNGFGRRPDHTPAFGPARSGCPGRTRVTRFYEVADADTIYYPAARQVMAVRSRTLSENARLFALLSMAIWDSVIACFETKSHFNLWRPVTAIREAQADGNRSTEPDAKWLPAVFTPPFPSYPSGHASFGGAARAALEDEFGAGGHVITLTHPAAPDIVLSYTTFKQITDDVDDARVYDGVRYRFDQEAGALRSKRVGKYILRHALRPVPRRMPAQEEIQPRRRVPRELRIERQRAFELPRNAESSRSRVRVAFAA